MKNVNLLAQLLEEPSFIAWLNGNGSAAENERWEKWLHENPNRRIIVAKAKKLISIPFSEFTLEPQDILNEFGKIQDQSHKLRLKKI